MILIVTVILVSARIVYFVKNKQKIVLYEELLKYSFIIYVLSLFYVVTFQDVSWSTSNFIPFKEMFRYPIFRRKHDNVFTLWIFYIILFKIR